MKTNRTAGIEDKLQGTPASSGESLGETMTVKLYTTPKDSRGERIRAWLEARAIPFIDYDIVSDPEALRHLIEISRSRNVPAVEIGELLLFGFDEHQLAANLSGRKEAGRHETVSG